MKIENLNLSALKYFFDAVENKSLTKAASLNYVTRSAIGQAINRLEEWAEKPLITHRRKQFELTSEGEEFYRQMKESFLSFKTSIETTRNGNRNIRIGCSTSLADSILIPNLKKIQNIEKMHLITGTSKQLRHLMEEEQIHLSLSVRESVFPNQQVIKKGEFILISKDGKFKKTVVTTETRPEVTALKNFFYNDYPNINLLTVESWTLTLKLAQELNYACLIPDFINSKDMKKIPIRGFDVKYEVVIESLQAEKLTSAEVELLNCLLS